MVKKIVTTIVLLVMIFSLCACGGEKDYGVKPSNLNDLMPEIWEETVEGLEFDYSVFDLRTSSEITIGKDITIFLRG